MRYLIVLGPYSDFGLELFHFLIFVIELLDEDFINLINQILSLMRHILID